MHYNVKFDENLKREHNFEFCVGDLNKFILLIQIILLLCIIANI